MKAKVVEPTNFRHGVKKTPEELFLEYRHQTEVEKEARSHKWAYAEAVQLERDRNAASEAGDHKRVIELNEVMRLAEAANDRGDFKAPWQVQSRREARKLLDSIGTPPGPVYSQIEYEQAMGELGEKFDAEKHAALVKAEKEGRVIVNRGSDRHHRKFMFLRD